MIASAAMPAGFSSSCMQAGCHTSAAESVGGLQHAWQRTGLLMLCEVNRNLGTFAVVPAGLPPISMQIAWHRLPGTELHEACSMQPGWLALMRRQACTSNASCGSMLQLSGEEAA